MRLFLRSAVAASVTGIFQASQKRNAALPRSHIAVALRYDKRSTIVNSPRYGIEVPR